MMTIIKCTTTTVIMTLMAASIVYSGSAKAQLPPSSPLGSYGLMSTYCGGDPLRVNSNTIPQFGCFVLSAGHSAEGEFSNHKVEVNVDEHGEENFKVDGVLVTELPNTRLFNVPSVHRTGDGYSFCQDSNTGYCPTHISIFSRNKDKSVIFMMAECFAPDYRTCVLSKENWDHEIARRRQ